MSTEKSGKLIQHLKDKWGNNTCPLCNANKWTVQDTVYELREFHGGNMVIGSGPILPIIPVTCENCGNTILVNALKVGVIEQTQEPEETSRSKEKKNAG